MATSGDRYLATSGDFFMATDTVPSDAAERSLVQLDALWSGTFRSSSPGHDPRRVSLSQQQRLHVACPGTGDTPRR